MKYFFQGRNRLTTLFFMMFITAFASGQRIEPGSQAHYQAILGISQEKNSDASLLLNGVYFDDPYIGARGNPYLFGDAFQEGSVVFRGKEYDGISLKYDVVDQRLIVDHVHPDYRLVTILNNEFLSGFTIGDHRFSKLTFNDGSSGFYEVVSKGENLDLYYHWRKSRSVSHHLEDKVSFVFSGSLKRMYLLLDGEVYRFRNNRTFLKIFPEESRSSVKDHLRKNRFRVNKVDDKTLIGIIEFADRSF